MAQYGPQDLENWLDSFLDEMVSKSPKSGFKEKIFSELTYNVSRQILNATLSIYLQYSVDSSNSSLPLNNE